MSPRAAEANASCNQCGYRGYREGTRRWCPACYDDGGDPGELIFDGPLGDARAAVRQITDAIRDFDQYNGDDLAKEGLRAEAANVNAALRQLVAAHEVTEARLAAIRANWRTQTAVMFHTITGQILRGDHDTQLAPSASEEAKAELRARVAEEEQAIYDAAGEGI